MLYRCQLLEDRNNLTTTSKEFSWSIFTKLLMLPRYIRCVSVAYHYSLCDNSDILSSTVEEIITDDRHSQFLPRDVSIVP